VKMDGGSQEANSVKDMVLSNPIICTSYFLDTNIPFSFYVMGKAE
jgi:hypothetical protein